MTDLITTSLVQDGPAVLHGALDVERTGRGILPHRLPAAARRQIPDGSLAMIEAQPSGVRLAFRTRATTVELEVLPTKIVYEGAPGFAPADGVYDLLVDGSLAAQASADGGDVLTVDAVTGATRTVPGVPATVRFTGLPGRAKEVEIWLPQAEITELIALRTDAAVHAPAPTGRRRWLHHGSSISHGAEAAGPTAIWPAVTAARADVDLVNLGLGGNALLDPFTARAIREARADLISLKIGINLVNADVMRLRALGPAVHGFLDTIRDGHSGTPLLVVSPILCPIVEDTPGPTAPDPTAPSPRFRTFGDPADVPGGRLTLNVIRAKLARIVAERAADDPNLHYLDGRELYGEADFAELPLPDRLHPDTAGHRHIGGRFARLVFGDGGAFGVPPQETGVPGRFS